VYSQLSDVEMCENSILSNVERCEYSILRDVVWWFEDSILRDVE
jgi:hypothetical protein